MRENKNIYNKIEQFEKSTEFKIKSMFHKGKMFEKQKNLCYIFATVVVITELELMFKMNSESFSVESHDTQWASLMYHGTRNCY